VDVTRCLLMTLSGHCLSPQRSKTLELRSSPRRSTTPKANEDYVGKLTIVSYEAGRFAIVGKLERIETIIERERS
jgi:hypothetical protein